MWREEVISEIADDVEKSILATTCSNRITSLDSTVESEWNADLSMRHENSWGSSLNESYWKNRRGNISNDSDEEDDDDDQNSETEVKEQSPKTSRCSMWSELSGVSSKASGKECKSSKDVSEFLQRVASGTKCKAESLLMGYFYVQRVHKKAGTRTSSSKQLSCFDSSSVMSEFSLINHEDEVSAHNVFWMLLCGVLVAEKFYADNVCCKNDKFAAAASIQRGQMNLMEMVFLALLDYDLFIDDDEYKAYLKKFDL
jgi:hypothetical protein